MESLDNIKHREEEAPGYIGRVIRILDNSSIIINVGKSALKSGRRVQVFSVIDRIEDLNGETLGYFYHIKDELVTIQVEEGYSVCQKLLDSAWTGALSPLLEQVRRDPGDLLIDKKQIRPLPEADNVIHVGDAVKIS